MLVAIGATEVGRSLGPEVQYDDPGEAEAFALVESFTRRQTLTQKAYQESCFAVDRLQNEKRKTDADVDKSYEQLEAFQTTLARLVIHQKSTNAAYNEAMDNKQALADKLESKIKRSLDPSLLICVQKDPASYPAVLPPGRVLKTVEQSSDVKNEFK